MDADEPQGDGKAGTPFNKGVSPISKHVGGISVKDLVELNAAAETALKDKEAFDVGKLLVAVPHVPGVKVTFTELGDVYLFTAPNEPTPVDHKPVTLHMATLPQPEDAETFQTLMETMCAWAQINFSIPPLIAVKGVVIALRTPDGWVVTNKIPFQVDPSIHAHTFVLSKNVAWSSVLRHLFGGEVTVYTHGSGTAPFVPIPEDRRLVTPAPLPLPPRR